MEPYNRSYFHISISRRIDRSYRRRRQQQYYAWSGGEMRPKLSRDEDVHDEEQHITPWAPSSPIRCVGFKTLAAAGRYIPPTRPWLTAVFFYLQHTCKFRSTPVQCSPKFRTAHTFLRINYSERVSGIFCVMNFTAVSYTHLTLPTKA